MASSQDGNLGLWSGYTPGDNGWTAQHNTNWDALDAFVQATVINTALATPPGSPANGAAYIVPAGATGAWASQTNKVAVWVARNAAWTFYAPKTGWMVYSQADSAEYIYSGSAWSVYYAPRLAVPQDYISGLKMIWNSGTSISVSTGAAFISSLGRLSQVNATLTLSSLSLTASTWYHVYLYENAGTPTIECVTTAPAAAYSGMARAKTGDTSRRYIGSVRVNSSGNLHKFFHNPATGSVKYLVDLNNADLFLVNAGTATTDFTVDCSSAVPVTSQLLCGFAENNAAGGIVYVSNADAGTPANGNILEFIRSSRTLLGDFTLTASQTLNYLVLSPASFSLYAPGYVYAR